MLAQNFKTPADLKITDTEFEALVKVLGMLERGEVPQHLFKMSSPGNDVDWNDADCGSPACICGWARFVVRARIFSPILRYPVGVRALFCMGLNDNEFDIRIGRIDPFKASPAQAGAAVRSFLATGEPHWTEAMVG